MQFVLTPWIAKTFLRVRFKKQLPNMSFNDTVEFFELQSAYECRMLFIKELRIMIYFCMKFRISVLLSTKSYHIDYSKPKSHTVCTYSLRDSKRLSWLSHCWLIWPSAVCSRGKMLLDQCCWAHDMLVVT